MQDMQTGKIRHMPIRYILVQLCRQARHIMQWKWVFSLFSRCKIAYRGNAFRSIFFCLIGVGQVIYTVKIVIMIIKHCYQQRNLVRYWMAIAALIRRNNSHRCKIRNARTKPDLPGSGDGGKVHIMQVGEPHSP